MKPLKILIFAAFYHPFRGGYVESIHWLALELIKDGHQITVVTCRLDKKDLEEEKIDGVQALRLPCWNILNRTYPIILPTLKTFRRLRNLRQENYDIVSTQTRFFTTSFVGVLWAWIYKKPLIHTERGAYHSVVPNPIVNQISHLIDHTFGALVVHRARYNVGVSNATCDFLKHLHAKNVEWIPNGVIPIPKINEHEKEILREKLGFQKKDKLLLFVGRLIYAKGLQDVFPVLKDLIALKPHLKLVVVGEGPYLKELQKKVKELSLERVVHFMGVQSMHEVQAFLQIADGFVNPSHSEGLPRSVLEAAAAGLPIVASDVGGTLEIIQDQKTGLLVPAHDSQALKKTLKILIENPILVQKLGQNAKDHIRDHFSWDHIKASYVALFEKVV